MRSLEEIRRTPAGLLADDEIAQLDPAGQAYVRAFKARRYTSHTHPQEVWFGRLPLREFERVFFPRDTAGLVILLHAYIDDSGTHDSSDVVSMGAFIAPFETWAACQLDWCAILDREPVEMFHMSKCEAGVDPFFWPWARRAALIHDLRQTIIQYKLLGTAFSVSHHDWDELVVGEDREYLGNAVDMAFGSSIGLLVSYARQLYPGEPIALVVDDQKCRKEDLQRILANYETLKEKYPELVTATFGSMLNVVPLQAADMLAWESYRYAQEWLATDGKPVARAHFKDFLAHGYIMGAIMGRKEIQQQLAAGYTRLP